MIDFLKNNSNTFSQPMILASILFVFAGPLGAFLGVVIGLLLGRKLDKNGTMVEIQNEWHNQDLEGQRKAFQKQIEKDWDDKNL